LRFLDLIDIGLNDKNDVDIVNGDFDLVAFEDSVLQNIKFRINTAIGDFALEPQCGTKLEDLFGRPNSPETAALLEQYVIQALSHDGFLYQGTDFDIKVFPVDKNTLSCVLTLSSSSKPYQYVFTYQLQ